MMEEQDGIWERNRTGCPIHKRQEKILRVNIGREVIGYRVITTTTRGREIIEFLLREVYFKDHSDGVKIEEVDSKIVITPRVDYMRDAFDDFEEYLNDNKEFEYNWENK